jgi:hypothetical protein
LNGYRDNPHREAPLLPREGAGRGEGKPLHGSRVFRFRGDTGVMKAQAGNTPVER